MDRVAALHAWPLQALPSAIPWNPFFVFLMVAAAAIVLMVAVLVVLSIVRFRERPGHEPAATTPDEVEHGNTRLEIAWTVAPAILVTIVFGLTFSAMQRGPTPDSGLPPGQQPEIEVVGHQWWWEIRYPQAGVVTANVLHLPVGRPVLVSLTADTVQHDFWVPDLGQKMDMYPGKINHIWLQADAPGAYQGACSEYCGTQHAWMRILAVAQPPAEYDAWLAAQQAAPPPPTTPPAMRGATVFDQQTCGSCHAIAGTQHTGQAGPNLSHFASRPTISAGVLENTPENLARYLHNPQAVKPGIMMPDFRLSDENVQALVAYLESLQ